MRSIPIPRFQQADGSQATDIAGVFEPISDYFLTDTLKIDGPQPVGGFVGITGETCDWNSAGNLVTTSRIPVILAGGITPDNVAEGIRRVLPAGVDSCTGTNACDPQGKPIRFQKDPNKVKRLVEAAGQAAKSTQEEIRQHA
jgi:phosphoribosylanthranilate isomerase